jgi:hypothetical protein
MIFLIEYNRPKGQIIRIQEFRNSERSKADRIRLQIELELNRREEVNHEVVLLEASSKEALRRTHLRYFEDTNYHIGVTLSTASAIGVKVTIDDKKGILGKDVKSALSITEKWVDIQYPNDSGLQAKLAALGYKITWCSDIKLARKLDLEGWEIVTEPDERGIPTKFRLKDKPNHQTLLKKRVSNQ